MRSLDCFFESSGGLCCPGLVYGHFVKLKLEKKAYLKNTAGCSLKVYWTKRFSALVGNCGALVFRFLWECKLSVVKTHK